MNNNEIMNALKAPFKPEEVQWRIGRKTKDKTKGEAMAYVDARAVMDRLDEVVGADKWEVQYIPVDMGMHTRHTYKGDEEDIVKGFLCKIILHLPEGDVTRMDGANCTDFSPFKGGLSGSFRRTASALGIGRYLYNLPAQWTPIDQWGNFTETPKLPAWALPEGYTPEPTQETPQNRPQSNYQGGGYQQRQQAPVTNENGEVVFPKGKFAGKPVSSVSDFGYLKWVVETSHMSEEVKAAASKVLADQQAASYDDEPDAYASGF